MKVKEESEKDRSAKASILRRSAFFMVQLSHPYLTTGKTIALTRWTFIGKVMSMLFILFYFIFILLYFTLQYCIGLQDTGRFGLVQSNVSAF